jgi:hypothetical protein
VFCGIAQTLLDTARLALGDMLFVGHNLHKSKDTVNYSSAEDRIQRDTFPKSLREPIDVCCWAERYQKVEHF